MKCSKARHKYLIKRNQELCHSFWNAYLAGYKMMDIYTQLSQQYGICLSLVRAIVADRRNWIDDNAKPKAKNSHQTSHAHPKS